MNEVSGEAATASLAELDARIHDLVDAGQRTHVATAVNLNPATNTMNPRAEALLSSGIGTRPSLGHPGEKYEMGLGDVEQVEVIAAELVARVFGADHVELRVPSGAIANLYVFLAACEHGDTIIVPPATIGGHVTHQATGAAGLRGLEIIEAPVDADGYTVDVDALARMVAEHRPSLVSIGGSMNLGHHPVAEIREVAEMVGATVLFDAAHLSGPIAGGAWPNPLAEGAHVLTCSTYKSLAGPPSGLLAIADAALAERIDAIAYPGLTANFDVAKTAALAVTMLDWLELGAAHSAMMLDNATALADALLGQGVPVHTALWGVTRSHAFAIDAGEHGGGHVLAQRLERANLLTSAIGLPHDAGAGLRLGTNELTRWGVRPADMRDLGSLVARAMAGSPEAVAADATAWREQFTTLAFVRD